MQCALSCSTRRQWLTFATGLVECLCFSGAVFGWASLVVVLKTEGYFSSVCLNTTGVSGTFNNTGVNVIFNKTGVSATVNNTGVNVIFNKTGVSATVNNTGVNVIFNKTGVNATGLNFAVGLNLSFTGVNKTHALDCSEQDENFSLVFTIASFASIFLSFPSGFVFDWFGTAVARIFAIFIFTVGTLMVAFSTPALSVLLFPALSLMGVGGRMYLMTNMQVGNLFGERRSTIITLYTGAFGSSSLLFLVIKLLYEAGVPLLASFVFLSTCSFILMLRTFFLLPWKKIPYPLPENYTYGITCCKSNAVSPEQTEVNIKSHIAENNSSMNKEKSFLECLLSRFFAWHLLWLSVIQLRHYLFIGTLNPMLQRLSGGDEAVVSQYSNAFALIQLCGVLFAPWNGHIMDRHRGKLKAAGVSEHEADLQAAVFSLSLTSLKCVLFSVCATIPILPLQYFTFFMQMLNRAFYSGSDAAFIHVIFPSSHFGKLYGLIKALSALVSLLQYPCFILVEDVLGGEPLYVNIGLTLLVLVTFIHPVSVYLHCRRLATKKNMNNVKNALCYSHK